MCRTARLSCKCLKVSTKSPSLVQCVEHPDYHVSKVSTKSPSLVQCVEQARTAVKYNTVCPTRCSPVALSHVPGRQFRQRGEDRWGKRRKRNDAEKSTTLWMAAPLFVCSHTLTHIPPPPPHPTPFSSLHICIIGSWCTHFSRHSLHLFSGSVNSIQLWGLDVKKDADWVSFLFFFLFVDAEHPFFWRWMA